MNPFSVGSRDGWSGRGNFSQRMDFVRRMMILTIECRWTTGCGPGGRPYQAFEENDFWLARVDDSPCSSST